MSTITVMKDNKTFNKLQHLINQYSNTMILEILQNINLQFLFYLYNMFELHFDRLTLAKASRYVVLISNTIETKRTEISQLWTSAPEFQKINISELSGLQLKVCEASLDKKLKIVGIGDIANQLINIDNNPIFEGNVKIEQIVQGNKVCVGICSIKIIPKIQLQAVSITNQHSQNQQLESELGEREEEQEQIDDEIRLQFHCGFNFYLGSAFRIQAEWGNDTCSTRPIKDKINPVWGQGHCLMGCKSKPIEIKILDSKDNILQNFKFQLQNLRIMFPYHIRLIFKQQFMGATPEIFISLVRQSHPRFSIMEQPLRFTLKNIGESLKNSIFLLVSFSKQPTFPTFMTVDRSKIATIQQINSYLVNKTAGDQQRADLIGLSNAESLKQFSILKSYLTRKLFLYVFWIADLKNCFTKADWTSCKLLQSKTQFQNTLKKVYYHGECFTLKKYLEIFNPIQQFEETGEQETAAEKWRILSNNYILRNQLVNSAAKHTQYLKSAIQAKGKQLIQLKKILKQVKLVSKSLSIKQKLTNVIKTRKISQFAKGIDTNSLISALFDKQTTLQGKKNLNSELALRMNSLADVQENQQDLDQQVVANSKQLLQQQEKIGKMKMMEKALNKQRQIIGQLEKIFEKQEIDKRVNQALREQGEKLKKIKQKKQQGLKNVYKLVQVQNQQGSNLAGKIKHAEETLISLNQQYARLTGL